MNSPIFFLPLSSSSLSLTHPGSGNFLVLCFLGRGWDNMELMAFQTMRESEILRECEESHSGGWVLCPRKVLASGVSCSKPFVLFILSYIPLFWTQILCVPSFLVTSWLHGQWWKVSSAIAVGTCGVFADNSLPTYVFFSISKVLDTEWMLITYV